MLYIDNVNSEIYIKIYIYTKLKLNVHTYIRFMCGHGYMICRWIYTCVSPYLHNGYTQVENYYKKKKMASSPMTLTTTPT